MSLGDIRLPDNIQEIGDEAFSNTLFYNDKANWENGVLYCGNYLIEADKDIYGNYKIREGTSLVAEQAFYGCNADSIDIPHSVKYIGRLSFDGCKSLASIDIPQGVLKIGDMAFYHCDSLNSITLPDSLVDVGYNAFYDTGFYNKKDNWENDILYLDNVLIYAHFDRKECIENCEIKQGTRVIADSAFPNGISIDEIHIPQSVQYIGSDAFRSYVSISNVHYYGSEEDWNRINIGLGNEKLLLAAIDFNGTPPAVDLTYKDLIEDAVVKVDGRYGYYRINVNLTNNIPRNKGYKLIAAAYDNGKLVETNQKNIFGYLDSELLTIFERENTDTIKIFVWNDIGNMRPMCEPKSITIKTQ